MLKLLQVGVRGMGNHWVGVGRRSSDFECVGYVDVVPEHLAQMQKEHGVPAARCYGDLAQALAATRPDAVVNVTPPQFHKPVALAALAAGCHVLTEKPIADTPENGREMVAAARNAGRILMVAQNYRYSPVIQALKARLGQGDLGEVGQVAIEFFRGPHFGGFRESMPQPLIVDMAIHHFDLMRYLLDAEPVSVYAQSFNPSWSWFGGDASASVLFNLRTKAGRPVHVNYAGSWCANGPDTPWNGHWRIVCAHGTLTLRDDVIQLQRAGNQPPESIPVPKLERAGQDYLLHAFAASIQSGRPPETSGEDNLNSIGMVFQAVASAEQGQALTF